jgi:hypothetical protein
MKNLLLDEYPAPILNENISITQRLSFGKEKNIVMQIPIAESKKGKSCTSFFAVLNRKYKPVKINPVKSRNQKMPYSERISR